MKIKYIFLVLLNCSLTILNQVLFKYQIKSDSLIFIRLAKYYNEGVFFEQLSNIFGHKFYSLFLAIIGGLISYNMYFIALVQSLIFCFSALFLIKELEIYYQKKLFGLALFLFLIPEIHFFNGYILTESLAFSLILLVFALSLKILNGKPPLINLFFISLLLGITIMNRIECAVSMFSVLYIIYPKIKDRLIPYLAIIISIPVLTLFLNSELNYKIFKVHKITSFGGGELIFSGNNENLDGGHHDFLKHKNVFFSKEKLNDFNHLKTLPQYDSFYLSLATTAWKKDPVQQLGVIPQKFARNWLLPGFFDIYTGDTTKASVSTPFPELGINWI